MWNHKDRKDHKRFKLKAKIEDPPSFGSFGAASDDEDPPSLRAAARQARKRIKKEGQRKLPFNMLDKPAIKSS